MTERTRDRPVTLSALRKFGTGWSLRVLHKDRVIVAASRAAKLAAPVLRIIDAAPRYAEGPGVRIPVRGSRQLATVARLAQIKREN